MKKHPHPFLRATAALAAGGLAVSLGAFSVSATTDPPTTEPATTSEPATTEPATTTTERATTTTAAPTTTVPAEIERQPLTGVPIDGTLIMYTPRPAMIVKIDNVGAARPQSGLNQADIVFEEIVEGRATRFAAAFNSQESNPVGPIRSGRTQDVDLLSSFNDPVFVWSGGNTGVTNLLQSTGWTLLGQGTEGFFRSGDRPGPHNLYANMEALWPQAGESGDAVSQFEYIAPGTDVAGTPISFVDVLVGHVDVHWEWDATAGLFMRSQQGNPHQLTDGQASANSVVVILTGYGSSSAGGGPEAVSVGSGDVVVYSNGRKIEGTWTRASRDVPFTLESGGEPILLAPGRTWVELVDGANYTLTDG